MQQKGVVGLCAAALVWLLVVSSSALAAALPDGRGYEMVSPVEKAGGGVGVATPRTRAAVDGSALSYLSLTPFGDAQGTGVETEYIARRGASGWTSHAITPRQEPLFVGATTQAASPTFMSEFSPDLSMGIFRAWSPLTNVPDVAQVENLYVRRDLLSPGPGSWSLATPCPACAGTPLTATPGFSGQLPWPAGQSADFRRVIFESGLNLTGDGPGIKLYMSEDGNVQLLGRVPPASATTCGGSGPACELPGGDGSSVAGLGARTRNPLENVISEDGSRVNFSAPTNDGTPDPSVGSVYQRDTHGTAAAGDDTTVLLNASERSTPGGSSGALYQGASSDGSRVFFTSGQELTDDASPLASPHLYMWHRELNDEVQRVRVSASGGTFTLSFGGQTTAALGASASAAQVGAALGALSSIGGVGGTVAVTGGPGDDGGGSPYLVAFGGDLGGRDLPLMAADGASLTGSAPAVDVAGWVAGGGHLTVIDRDEEPGDAPGAVEGVIRTSRDGSYVYFIANSQLVAGEPLNAFDRSGIYLWHDGQISYVAAFTGTVGGAFDWWTNMPVGNSNGHGWTDNPSRVTPDGKTLVFGATNGSGLTGYDHTGCGDGGSAGCQELYVYQAASGRLRCASCPSGPPSSDATAQTTIIGGVLSSAHESHSLSDDGRRVFFTTGESLVEQDTNGKNDAYEYDVASGSVSLLSSGKSPKDSYFMEASASGDDAFFATRERLVGWDVDDAYDFYDARVGGGFPEPKVSLQCSVSACQGPLVGAPALVGGATAGYVGSGNVQERLRNRARAKRCRRGKARKKVRGRVRCVRRSGKAKHKRHRSASGTGKRGSAR